MLSAYLFKPPAPDNIYWLFSSSAQSISAFVAFLLTGYTFVHSVMENIQQRDDSLLEVHHELRKRYYRQVQVLSITTGAAIIASLAMVFFNGTAMVWRTFFVISTSVLNIASIALGIRFVLTIINPDRYRAVASQLATASTQTTATNASPVPARVFFEEFLPLESQVRNMLDQQSPAIAPALHPRRLSFRASVQILRQDHRISERFCEELLEISTYRNLVFHGDISEVDPQMVERVRVARQQLSELPPTP